MGHVSLQAWHGGGGASAHSAAVHETSVRAINAKFKFHTHLSPGTGRTIVKLFTVGPESCKGFSGRPVDKRQHGCISRAGARRLWSAVGPKAKSDGVGRSVVEARPANQLEYPLPNWIEDHKVSAFGGILLQKSIFADDQNSAGRGRDFRVQDARDLTASRKIRRRLR